MRREKKEELNYYIHEYTPLQIVKTLNSRDYEVERYGCGLENGEIIFREKVVKNYQSDYGVQLLPITDDEQILLEVKPTIFKNRPVSISLPVGYLDSKEWYGQTAQRVLLRLGCQSKNIHEICDFTSIEDYSAAHYKGLLADNCIPIRSADVPVFECSFEELNELIDMGYIPDAGSQLMVEKGKQYIKRRY